MRRFGSLGERSSVRPPSLLASFAPLRRRGGSDEATKDELRTMDRIAFDGWIVSDWIDIESRDRMLGGFEGCHPFSLRQVPPSVQGNATSVTRSNGERIQEVDVALSESFRSTSAGSGKPDAIVATKHDAELSRRFRATRSAWWIYLPLADSPSFPTSRIVAYEIAYWIISTAWTELAHRTVR